MPRRENWQGKRKAFLREVEMLWREGQCPVSCRSLNQTTGHSYTQAASCEISSCAIAPVRNAWTAAVTSGV